MGKNDHVSVLIILFQSSLFFFYPYDKNIIVILHNQCIS